MENIPSFLIELLNKQYSEETVVNILNGYNVRKKSNN